MKLDLKMYDRYSVVRDAIDRYIELCEEMMKLAGAPAHKAAYEYYSNRLAVASMIKEELNEL